MTNANNIHTNTKESCKSQFVHCLTSQLMVIFVVENLSIGFYVQSKSIAKDTKSCNVLTSKLLLQSIKFCCELSTSIFLTIREHYYNS